MSERDALALAVKETTDDQDLVDNPPDWASVVKPRIFLSSIIR
jgi:hypothetical protein